MKFDFKKWLVSGFLGGIVFFVLSFIGQFIIQSFWPYNALELPGMRSIEDPVLLLFFLYPFVLSFAMALVFQAVFGSLKGNFEQKGRQFGVLCWLLASIPSAFVVFSSMNYPVGFHVENFIFSFAYLVAAGIVIARFSE